MNQPTNDVTVTRELLKSLKDTLASQALRRKPNPLKKMEEIVKLIERADFVLRKGSVAEKLKKDKK